MKNSIKKDIPNFATEDEEREFWSTADSTEYIDWSAAKKVVFQNLKPSMKKNICPSAGNYGVRTQSSGK